MSDKKPNTPQQPTKTIAKDSGRALPPTKLSIPMPPVKPPAQPTGKK